jgi:O-antigen ligase
MRVVAVGAASLVVLTLLVSMAATNRSFVSNQYLKERLLSIADREQESNSAHMTEWEITVRETMKQPFLGLGFGSKHSGVPGVEGMPTHTVHNAFLMLWMKMGIIPVGFLLWWLLRYVRFGIRTAQIEDDTTLRAIQRALFATLGYWAVSLNVGPAWHYYRETFLMALVVALVIRLATLKPTSPPAPALAPQMGDN